LTDCPLFNPKKIKLSQTVICALMIHTVPDSKPPRQEKRFFYKHLSTSAHKKSQALCPAF
tara:strand:- start:145 stop:324 length:180 start_codon:yes stop_codon:yes gene_type:complete